MEKLEYEIEFITPAFIGGAEPNKYAELRPASFVGLLRYWFRVIVGAYVQKPEELFKLESELFGSQDRAGKVWVRIKGNVKKELSNCVRWEAWKDGGKDWGKVYMGYGNIIYVNFRAHKNREKYKNLLKKCREQEGNHIIRSGNFSVRPWLGGENNKPQASLEVIVPEAIKETIEALAFIVSQIGCIGSRSRRGWGSLCLIPKYKSPFKNWDVWDAEELKKAFKVVCGRIPENLEFYRMDYRQSQPMKVLEEAGKLFRDFRQRMQPDYETVKSFISGDIKDEGGKVEIKRAYFGLPLRFRFSSLNGKEAEVNTDTGRFASPIRFKVIRAKNNLYSCLLIHIKNQSLPDQITLSDGNNQIQVHKPSPDIVDEFIRRSAKFVREDLS
ncbi:type III-B CRISPR module RAMP protein Cmr1 [Hydrogenivirga sp. 128-5-R1-1]|uniref:type III-B CRISPR module RAMP protein Cmr1 n=1 Tax=Hydrogenivirga sp. 128-5-R1-1 TaxID=392423 RepID=UPI00015F0C7C|nr:type III-B CRISPR module RAMP protein Cmr1 [Hydrogenivirga sp. 128-5-R1-1]EDP75980.1 hypothetical cytosolic protein [Hydrogenivirga sp. 128-5-R1-1]